MKHKLLIIIGSIFAILLIAAIAIPLLVDVDKFRPQIVKAVNDKINGELSLGKISLSMLGCIKVRIESVSLKLNGVQKPLVSTNSAYLEVPIFPLITMRPTAN